MNLKHLILFFAVFAIVYAFNDDSVKGIEFLPNFLPKFAGNKYCATEDIYKWKKAMRSLNSGSPMADCQIEGVCDNFQERNRWNNAPLNIKLFITVICFSETSCPGNVDRQKVEGQISQINKDFNATNISFSFDESSLQFVVDATYAEIAAYSNFNSLWYTQLLGLKTKYAHKPTEYLNIFVTGQRSGSSGTLLGIGTFPWDPEALQAVGGLWVNANYWGLGEKTASHEIGHNVGLWHTFHGDSEVRCTDACYEVVHQDSGDDTFSNTVGDFCADTPAQPMNYYCSYPTGSDCKGNRYTLYGNNPALINNFMAYTPDSCMQYFTNQQSMRAACWICDRAWQWVEGQCPRK